MTKLRRCPFCGGEVATVVRLGEIGEDYVHPEYFEVICDAQNGGCGAAIGGEYPTEEEAISAWNKRVAEINTAADKVNHPAHYTQGGIECIEAIRAATGEGFPDYCRGNVIKYIWRYAQKNGVEDLKKAAVYLQWMIDYLEEKTND